MKRLTGIVSTRKTQSKKKKPSQVPGMRVKNLGDVLYFDESRGTYYIEVAVPKGNGISGFFDIRKNLETTIRLESCPYCQKADWRIISNSSNTRRKGAELVECFKIRFTCNNCGKTRRSINIALNSAWERLSRSLREVFDRVRRISISGDPNEPGVSLELNSEEVILPRC